MIATPPGTLEALREVGMGKPGKSKGKSQNEQAEPEAGPERDGISVCMFVLAEIPVLKGSASELFLAHFHYLLLF